MTGLAMHLHEFIEKNVREYIGIPLGIFFYFSLTPDRVINTAITGRAGSF
jgi:hypothetical protein